MTVQVSEPLLVNLPDTIFLCQSAETILTPIITGSATSYVWSNFADFTDTLNADLQNPILTLVDPQNQTYYFQAYNGYCSVIDSVHISVFGESISIQCLDSICITDVLQLQALNNGTGSFTYLWSSPNVLINPNNQATAQCTLPGSQYIYLQATSPQVCFDLQSINDSGNSQSESDSARRNCTVNWNSSCQRGFHLESNGNHGESNFANNECFSNGNDYLYLDSNGRTLHEV
jgi:hypothetical protein